ncbi:MAG: AMP-binding protein [Prevotellaceae bacterium]|jgi:long-chain acyl-CoA synthetase|nr:AMP-binding protein [Prevotellaceae bacterium]
MSRTIISLFEEGVAKYPHSPLIWEKRAGIYDYMSYSDVQRKARVFAAGLMKLGLEKGDRVALMAEGCSSWLIGELGVLYAAAINVPLSIKLNADEVQFRLKHSGAKFLMVSKFQAPKVQLMADKVSSLEKTIYFEPIASAKGPNDLTMHDVMLLGEEYLRVNTPLVEARTLSVRPNDYANICYTSGTTADPKGIILTHRNYTANVEQAVSLIDIPAHYVALHILPWDHSFAHTAGLFVFMKIGASFASVDTGKSPMDMLKNIPINIKEIRPHVMLSVPALAQNFRKNIESGIAAKGAIVKAIFKFGIRVAYKYNGVGFDKGKGLKKLLAPISWFYLNTLFRVVRKQLGGRMKFFVGGGAILDVELQRFFYAIGIPMYQGYGLSEASPIISANSGYLHKLGSSGAVVKPLNLMICDDEGKPLPAGKSGEIVISGENVMAGYWSNPQATAEAIRNGWLYTGDLGYMDTDGFLHLKGRFKSLLIADDGEKYSPELIEEAVVAQSPYIDQCILHNNQNAYVVALLVPSVEAIKKYLQKQNINPNTEEGAKAALMLLQEKLHYYRKDHKFGTMFPQSWLPAAFGVASEPFTEANGLVNSTMKVVRRAVEKAYEDRIKYMHDTPSAKDPLNEQNVSAMCRLLK